MKARMRTRSVTMNQATMSQKMRIRQRNSPTVKTVQRMKVPIMANKAMKSRLKTNSEMKLQKMKFRQITNHDLAGKQNE